MVFIFLNTFIRIKLKIYIVKLFFTQLETRKYFIAYFNTDATTIFLNGVRVRAFPMEHLSAIRGLADPALLYCDEAPFFNRSDEVISVLERYAVRVAQR